MLAAFLRLDDYLAAIATGKGKFVLLSILRISNKPTLGSALLFLHRQRIRADGGILPPTCHLPGYLHFRLVGSNRKCVVFYFTEVWPMTVN